MLEKLPTVNSPVEYLFVGTDRYMYFVLSWDAKGQHLRTEKSYVDQTDKTGRDSMTQDRCLIDPSCQFLALQLYDGIVTVIPLKNKNKKKGSNESEILGEPVSTRISDLFIRSSAFLYPRQENKEQRKLAFLYEDTHQKVHLNIRALDYTAGGIGDSGDADLENIISSRDNLEPGASHLIPIPAPACKYASGSK